MVQSLIRGVGEREVSGHTVQRINGRIRETVVRQHGRIDGVEGVGDG